MNPSAGSENGRPPICLLTGFEPFENVAVAEIRTGS